MGFACSLGGRGGLITPQTATGPLGLGTACAAPEGLRAVRLFPRPEQSRTALSQRLWRGAPRPSPAPRRRVRDRVTAGPQPQAAGAHRGPSAPPARAPNNGARLWALGQYVRCLWTRTHDVGWLQSRAGT